MTITKRQVLKLALALAAKDAVAEAGTTVASFKYHLPDVFRKLSEHAKAMRERRTKARFDAHCEQAVAIACRLFSESSHVPRRRLDRALGEVDLSIRSPMVRKAAVAELRRLREAAAKPGKAAVGNASAP